MFLISRSEGATVDFCPKVFPKTQERKVSITDKCRKGEKKKK